MLFKGTNSYRINSCEPIEVFYNIRTDLDKLKYAAHITKIVNDVTDENQNTYRILQLLLNTLYVISESDKNLDLVLSIFRLRLLCIMGFRPMTNKCGKCGEDKNIKYFDVVGLYLIVMANYYFECYYQLFMQGEFATW